MLNHHVESERIVITTNDGIEFATIEYTNSRQWAVAFTVHEPFPNLSFQTLKGAHTYCLAAYEG